METLRAEDPSVPNSKLNEEVGDLRSESSTTRQEFDRVYVTRSEDLGYGWRSGWERRGRQREEE